MAKYRVELTRSAEQALWKIPKKILPKIVAALEGLAVNPLPHGCRKLSGQMNTFRIRVNVYRIIYEIYERIVLVKVLKIGHRRDVYR